MSNGPAVIQYKTKSDYLAKKPNLSSVAPDVASQPAPISKTPVAPSQEAVKSNISNEAKQTAKQVADVASKLPPTPPIGVVADVMGAVIPAAKNEDDEKKDEVAELAKKEQVKEIIKKQAKVNDTPAIIFLKGFSFSSSSGDGLEDMASAIPNSEVYSWADQDEAIASILERPRTQPVVLIGHSFGGDSVVEVAQELNKVEHGFRKIDLLVTLDSVGFDNDIIPQNVKMNLNFIGDDWYGINDSPNIARNTDYTNVINELREDSHRGIENNEEVQLKIFERLDSVLKQAVASKTAGNLDLNAHKDLKGIRL